MYKTDKIVLGFNLTYSLFLSTTSKFILVGDLIFNTTELYITDKPRSFLHPPTKRQLQSDLKYAM